VWGLSSDSLSSSDLLKLLGDSKGRLDDFDKRLLIVSNAGGIHKLRRIPLVSYYRFRRSLWAKLVLELDKKKDIFVELNGIRSFLNSLDMLVFNYPKEVKAHDFNKKARVVPKAEPIG
jgi:hypothetical protein